MNTGSPVPTVTEELGGCGLLPPHIAFQEDERRFARLQQDFKSHTGHFFTREDVGLELLPVKAIFLLFRNVRRHPLGMEENVDGPILAVVVAFREVHPAAAVRQIAVHHRDVGQAVIVRQFSGAGHQGFVHGVDADVFVHRQFLLVGQKPHRHVLGGAGPPALAEQDQRIFPAGIIPVRHGMHVAAGVPKGRQTTPEETGSAYQIFDQCKNLVSYLWFL